MRPSTVLSVLAELAPAAAAAERTLDVTRGSQALVWLGNAEKAPRQAAVDRLAALDALHREERILHRGWGFLAGSHLIDGKTRKVRVPLLSQPVRLERALGGYRIAQAGDLEITPLIEDRDLAAAMEAAPGLAAPGWLDAIGSRAWLRAAAEATGLPFETVTDSGNRLPKDRLVLVAAAALYVARDVFGVGLSDSLRSWAGRELTGTALAAMYGEARPADTGHDDEPVLSPLPLSDEQARVVARARTAPITVVSGPPGSGKSHTVVAAALEVVHRGGSVLVATQSPHAAEVLAGLLSRYPGPAPVLFGDAAGRADLEAELTAGADQGASAERLRAGQARLEAAIAGVRSQRTALTEALSLERRATELTDYEPLLPELAADVPGAFRDDVDPVLVADLLAGESTGGWWSRRRARAARRRALRMLGLSRDALDDGTRGDVPGKGPRKGVPGERVTEALAAAAAQRATARLAATGGTRLESHWAALHAAEDALREAAGDAMRDAARSAKRWDRDARRAAGALAGALRAGRNRRRELLAQLDAPPLVRALPLWIGTVADVEDLLPPEPGLFDLVVIDEASHVDQIRAAPVLARARRALVVGDPRQLRFVSFVSDVDVAEVLSRHGADERLDVRRVSAYDLAAGEAPVTWLSSHYRSVPHLIGFSARRFYADRVSVMTRNPAADAADAIEVVRAGDEIAAALRAVGELADAGYRGIGVISPFRAQAEALESALLAAFPAEKIEDLRVRVGTVHAFQGSEADAVVVSLGLADSDGVGRRRFVTDPQLFNVMITRARRRMVVVSGLSAADGLLGDYLEWAAGPPSSRLPLPSPSPSPSPSPLPSPSPSLSPSPEVAAEGWAGSLAAELERIGVPVRAGYAVGPWSIDLVAGSPERFAGVICSVHSEHLARQVALHRAGWQLIDAFPSRWGGDPKRAALEIAATVCPNPTLTVTNRSPTGVTNRQPST
ncbi:AAA domain-containing protein [Actinoplanes sp. NPDC023936]|uniref:AAA domain-containing protein n=1 Tax=Actinoplanes sp. NPDC023936 TaxID=3154910 RepID=UPI0033F4A0EC